jgi:DNA mismatch repair protein MutH
VTLPDHLTSRIDALHLLRTQLPGKNLYDLAEGYGVTIKKSGRVNKGWVGQTLERVAQLRTGNSQSRDGLDFELKSTTLIAEGDRWLPKETIKITQLSPREILDGEFESSSLWLKLERLIFVGCVHESNSVCRVVQVSSVDVTSPDLVEEIRAFWNDVKLALWLGEMADHPNLGSSRDYIQLRPIGTGKNLTPCPVSGRPFPSRAFYATKRFLSRILELG